MTNIFLEHFLYPPGVNALATEQRNEIPPAAPVQPIINEAADIYLPLNDDDTLTINVISPANPQLPFRPSFTDVSSSQKNNCGKPIIGVKYLIARGERTLPGQWPWLAAIFITRKKFEFQCAGTLITDRHILTGKLNY